jgi:hypothetical protein
MLSLHNDVPYEEPIMSVRPQKENIFPILTNSIPSSSINGTSSVTTKNVSVASPSKTDQVLLEDVSKTSPVSALIGTINSSALNETSNWHVLIGTGSDVHIFGIVCSKKTNEPHVVLVTKEFRDECNTQVRPLKYPPAALIAHKIFGLAPSKKHMEICATARVFSGGDTFLVAATGLDKLEDGLISLARQDVVLPKHASWTSAANATLDIMTVDEKWSSDRLKKGALVTVYITIAIIILKSVFSWGRNSKSNSTQNITRGTIKTIS